MAIFLLANFNTSVGMTLVAALFYADKFLVGDEEHVLSYEFLGLIELCDAAHDGAVVARAVVDGELQQLVCLLHLLAVLDVPHTDVQLLKVALSIPSAMRA